MPGIPLEPPGWPRPRGYSNGMQAQGALVAVAGQIGWDETGRLVDGGFAAQFEQTLANVLAVVRVAGGGPRDVISLTVYVVDKQEYAAALAEVGAAWKRLMGKHFPAMALVEVAGLVEPGAKVEIQGLAAIAPP